jgi:hypothetical protein
VFTLGQFFDAWQVALGPRRLGGLQATRVKGPPGSVELTPHQEIAVTCRPGSGLRGAVPDGYAVPPGT